MDAKPKEVTAPPQQPRPSPRLVPLSRTHSTEGIASKVSLELKKRYLLGGGAGPSPPAISTTRRTLIGTPAVPPAPALDSKLRCLADAISEHQKLLNPAPEPSAAMQTFLQKSSSTSDTQQQHLAQTPLVTLQKDIDSIRKRLLSDYAAKTPPISALSFSKLESTETVIPKQGVDEQKKPQILADRQPEDIVIINKSETNVTSSPNGKLVNGICNKGVLDFSLHSGLIGSKEVVKSPTGLKTNGDLEETVELSKSSKMINKAKETASASDKDVKQSLEENKTPSTAIADSAPLKVQIAYKSEVETVDAAENIEDQLDSKGEWIDCRPRSPVHETSIEVPKVNWDKVRQRDDDEENDIDDEDEQESLSEDSLQDDYYEEKDIDEAEVVEKVRPVPPVVVVEETPVEEVETIDLEIIPAVTNADDIVPIKCVFEEEKKVAEISQYLEENHKEKIEKPKEGLISESEKEVVINQCVLDKSDYEPKEEENALNDSSGKDFGSANNVALSEDATNEELAKKVDKVKPDSKRDFALLPLKKVDDVSLAADDEVPTPTETEELSSDWARDTDAANSVGEDLELELCMNPIYINTCDRRRRDKLRKRGGRIHKKSSGSEPWLPTSGARKAELEEDFTVEPSAAVPPPLPSVPPPSLSQVSSTPYCPEDIEFMDVGTDGSSDEHEECQKRRRRRKGYTQLTEGGDPLAAEVDDEGEVTPVAEDEDDEEDSSSDTVSGVKRSRTVEAVNCIAIGLAEEEEDGFSPAQDDTTTPSDAVTTVIESQPIVSVDAEEAEEEDRLGGLAVRSPPKDEDEEYEGHVRRLKGRVSPFSNARDSIDIRKSRKQQQKGKEAEKGEQDVEKEDENILVPKESPLPSENNVSREEKVSVVNVSATESSSPVSLSSRPTSVENVEESSFLSSPPTSPVTPLSSSSSPPVKSPSVCNPTIIRPYVNSPSTSRKLEEISRERSKQKDLIREMVIARLGSEGGSRRSSSVGGVDRRRGRSPRASSSSVCSPDTSGSPPATCEKEANEELTSSPPIAPPKSPEATETKHAPTTTLSPSRSLSMSPHFTPPTLSNIRARAMQRRHSLHSQEPLSVESESSMDEVFCTPSAMVESPPASQNGGKIRPLSVHCTSRGLSSSSVGLGGMLPDTPLTNPDAFSMPDIRKALFKTPSALSAGKTEETVGIPIRPVRKKDSTSMEKQGILESAAGERDGKPYETKSDFVNTGVAVGDGSKSQLGRGEERGIDVVMPTLGKDMAEASASTLKEMSPPKLESTCGVESPKLDIDGKEGEKVVMRKDGKKGNKDRERRKSIIQAVSDFFGGKKGSASSTSTTASSSTPSSPPPAALLTSPSPTSSVTSPTHSVGKERDGKDKSCDKFPRFPRLHPRSKGYKLGNSSSSEFESDSDGYDDKDKKMSLSERGLTSGSEKDLTYHGNLTNNSKTVSPRLITPDRALPLLSLPPPPPLPPPLNLQENVSNRIAPKATEESFSEGEVIGRVDRLPSTGTAASTPSHETPSGGSSLDSSASALPLLGGKQSRQARRKARQAQLQRLRMAQEIQRQLEELEVKQRLLEKRGVSVEKALRGEEKGGSLGTKLHMGSECLGDEDEEDDDDDDDDDGEEEAKLLQEWFELMRERSELRRCERELLVRAEELSLEDRHSRLQADLRDRLAQDDSTKTKSDVAREGEILGEMLEIVERRDSLMALLEEDRQRYHEEDQDLESQMLAKGLHLSPIRKESHV